MTRTNIFALMMIPILGLTACGGGERQNESVNTTEGGLQATLNHTVDSQITPAFSALHTRTQHVQTAANDFCTAPDMAGLQVLQQAWQNLSLQWNQTAYYNFGPLNDDLISPRINFIESMRQRGTDYTGTVRAEIETQLNAQTPLNTDYFNGLAFTKTGLLSLEVLLFEDSRGDHSQAAADILEDYRLQPRKCDYLNGMADYVNRLAQTLNNEWQHADQSGHPPYAAVFKNEQMQDDSEAIPTLLTSVQNHLDYIKRRKLQGVKDARLSGMFYQNILAMLDGIESLLKRNGAQPSFFSYMASGGYNAAIDTVETNLAAARAAARQQDDATLATYIGLLDGNFKREIPDSLAVTLGINFNDGD